MIRFIEVLNATTFNPRLERTAIPRFTLGEVWINEKYVISIKEAKGYQNLLEEGLLPPHLDANHQFSIVTTHNGEISESHTVVGAPDAVAAKLSHDRKQLLKG